MAVLRFETTIGKLEVWLGSGGELQVFQLNEEDRATRMLGQVVGNESELGEVLEQLGLIDREAAWYAEQIWRIVAPSPEPGLEERRKLWGKEDLPRPLWLGDPTPIFIPLP